MLRSDALKHDDAKRLCVMLAITHITLEDGQDADTRSMGGQMDCQNISNHKGREQFWRDVLP